MTELSKLNCELMGIITDLLTRVGDYHVEEFKKELEQMKVTKYIDFKGKRYEQGGLYEFKLDGGDWIVGYLMRVCDQTYPFVAVGGCAYKEVREASLPKPATIEKVPIAIEPGKIYKFTVGLDPMYGEYMVSVCGTHRYMQSGNTQFNLKSVEIICEMKEVAND